MVYTDEQFAEGYLAAMRRLDSIDTDYTFRVQSGFSGKPRASSIAGCGRAQLYALTDEPVTEVTTDKGYDKAEDLWSAWMGHAGEAIARRVLTEMGYNIAQPDVYGSCQNCNHPVQTEDECVLCVCADHTALMSGHVDGVIEGLDLDTAHIWDSKVRNVFAYKKLLEGAEVADADKEMYGQMQSYMMFLDLERTMITVQPHDLSTTRNQMTRRKEPIVTPSYAVFRRFIASNAEHQSVIAQRADGITTAKALGIGVAAEYDPMSTYFPCGWCPWKSRCTLANIEGGEEIELPPIPWGED